MIVRVQKSLYPLDAVLKASYTFTEQAYIHLDEDDESYLVEIRVKSKSDSEETITGEFYNELLAQIVRKQIRNETQTIRELVFQRAMSSSMIASQNVEGSDDGCEYDLEQILKDWFECNEQHDS